MSSVDQPVTDWGNTLYSGLNDVGVFKADLFMIIALILGLVFVVVGIYMIIYDDSNEYLRIKGLIMEPSCTKASTTYDDKGKPTDTYKCSIIVSYKVDNKTYSKKMYLSGNSTYIKDEPIDLMIKKRDLNDVQLATMNNTSIGTIMIICSLFVVAIAYLNYYLTHNYKVFAAAQGTETIVSLFR